MCEFCVRHGEGKKWYEIMENYSAELYAHANRESFVKDFVMDTQTTAVAYIDKLDKFQNKFPRIFKGVSKIGTWIQKRSHFGQVVPLEDAEKIIDMVQSITRIPCVCRSALKGNKNARYCFAIGFDPSGMFADFPELKANLETISREEAKSLLNKFDKEGLVHSIWTFKTPFIGAICNCDRDCLPYRVQVASQLVELMFKAEYVARVSALDCVACRECQKLCQFGAIEYSSMDQKCTINYTKCYGCGVCRRACKKSAIELEDRTPPSNYQTLWR